jgi:multidrug efflux pump subunit AcrA (membrane-fusion protein)
MNAFPRWFLIACAVLRAVCAQAADTQVSTDTVVLDAAGVKNLRIKTEEVLETEFEETVFALGRIEAMPSKVGAVSSRIAGRVVALHAFPGDAVAADAEVAKVESRQPGSPPPVVSVRSPLRGIVTRLDVRLGDPVEPDRALLEIADLSDLHAIARVPEHAAGRIAVGATARVVVSATPEKNFEGKLLRFGTVADPDTGTLGAVFAIANPEGRLRPGMRAEFSIIVATRANVLRIPRSALQGEPAKRFVFVKHLDLPNAFVKVPVAIGQSDERFVEILSGLLPADDVVTEGAYSLAFAGGGSVSLKEALDAAHGHEHNADGSELSVEQGNKKDSRASATHHDHAQQEDHEGPFWKIASGVLFLLLIVVSFRRPRAATGEKRTLPAGNDRT